MPRISCSVKPNGMYWHNRFYTLFTSLRKSVSFFLLTVLKFEMSTNKDLDHDLEWAWAACVPQNNFAARTCLGEETG